MFPCSVFRVPCSSISTIHDTRTQTQLSQLSLFACDLNLSNIIQVQIHTTIHTTIYNRHTMQRHFDQPFGIQTTNDTLLSPSSIVISPFQSTVHIHIHGNHSNTPPTHIFNATPTATQTRSPSPSPSPSPSTGIPPWIRVAMRRRNRQIRRRRASLRNLARELFGESGTDSVTPHSQEQHPNTQTQRVQGEQPDDRNRNNATDREDAAQQMFEYTMSAMSLAERIRDQIAQLSSEELEDTHSSNGESHTTTTTERPPVSGDSNGTTSATTATQDMMTNTDTSDTHHNPTTTQPSARGRLPSLSPHRTYTMSMDFQPVTVSSSIFPHLEPFITALGTSAGTSSNQRTYSGIPIADLSSITSFGTYRTVMNRSETTPSVSGLTSTTDNGDANSNRSNTEGDSSSDTDIEENDREQCGICQEPFLSDTIVRQITRCRHCFHPHCIERWFADHQTCPLCMQDATDTNESGR